MTGRARAACYGTKITRTASVIQPCHASMPPRRCGTTHGAHMPRRVADASDPIRPEQQLRPPVPLSDRLAQCSHGSRAARKGREECCRHIEPARVFRCILTAHPVRRHALRRAHAVPRPYPVTAPSLGTSHRRKSPGVVVSRQPVADRCSPGPAYFGSCERARARINTGSS